MSDLGHSLENRKRIIELLDAIKSARSPAQVRELGEELAAAVAADRAGEKVDEARPDPAS
jgi:hypothetical protein